MTVNTINEELIPSNETDYYSKQVEIIKKKSHNIQLTKEEEYIDSFCLPFSALVANKYYDEFFIRAYLGINRINSYEHILLEVFLDEWEKLINNEHHDDIVLQKVAKETKIELKQLRGRNNYQAIRNAIATSKFKYISIKKILDVRLVNNVYAFTVKEKQFIFNAEALVHIIFGHYGGISKQYDSKKDFFTKDFWHEDLASDIEKILVKIFEQEDISSYHRKVVDFRYMGTIYRLCFGYSHQNDNNKWTVTSFFPVERQNILKQLNSEFKEIWVDDNLSYFLDK